MVYSLLGRDLRGQIVQRSLETISVRNAITGQSNELPITAKTDHESAEVSAQWITKWFLFVTSDFDTGWLVSSFHQRKLIWIRSYHCLPFNDEPAQRLAEVVFCWLRCRAQLGKIERRRKVRRQAFDRRGIWMEVRFSLNRQTISLRQLVPGSRCFFESLTCV